MSSLPSLPPFLPPFLSHNRGESPAHPGFAFAGSIYRYTHGVNWRAVAAFAVGVAPNLPGFINGINPSVDVGVGKRPYAFAWILGFAITSLVYVALSTVFPPTETMVPRAVLPDEVYGGEGGAAVAIEGEAVGEDVERGDTGEEGWKKGG